MAWGLRRRVTVVVAATGLVAVPAVVFPGTAEAVACTGQVTYARSSNTIKLTSGEVDLPTVKSLCPAAPLVETDAATNTWLLMANLLVQNGAALHVRGTRTQVDPAGAVDTLRLLSRAGNSSLEVVNVTADHGTLTFESTHVTSWDDTARSGVGDVDREPGVGTATPGDKTNGIGRAFVRAISRLDPGGAPRESRMDITGSEMAYLGYYAAESYGVAYKGRGCDLDHLSVCEALNVHGSQRGSHFHHNYMGTYTFNAYDMVFDSNEYDHNVTYGLDPHDDSDHLTITNNRSHHNGAHGIICSQRCDHLTITGNESHHNGSPVSTPAGDEEDSPQVHGIMIHRGVSDSLIAGNDVHDNNGAGIAVFDSFRNTVRGNTLTNNLFGLRSSVGSHDNTYTGNAITRSRRYAVYTYPGRKDTAYYGIPGGRPTRERFLDNTVTTTGSSLVNLQQSDDIHLLGTTVRGTVGELAADSSTGVVWDADSTPGTGIVLADTTRAADATVRLPLAAFTIDPGQDGVVMVLGRGGQLADVSGHTPFATVTAGSGTAMSAYTLDTAGIGASSSTVTPRPVTVVPSTGSVQARISGFTSAVKHLYVRPATAGTTLAISWGGLTPNTTYYVRDDGRGKTPLVSSSTGVLTWTHTATTGTTHDLTIGTS